VIQIAISEIYQKTFNEDVQPDEQAGQCPECKGPRPERISTTTSDRCRSTRADRSIGRPVYWTQKTFLYQWVSCACNTVRCDRDQVTSSYPTRPPTTRLLFSAYTKSEPSSIYTDLFSRTSTVNWSRGKRLYQ